VPVANGGSILRVLGGVFLAALVPLGLGVRGAHAGAGVLEQRDIQYAPGVALDTFVPDEAHEGVPAVLLVHGGGWRTGDKASWADEARTLVAGTGWVAVTVNYDLEAAHPWIDQPDQVRAAIAWVQANAASLGVDPDRIGLVGSSAGGHLSMLVATTGAPVRAVVSWSGPTDLPRLTQSPVTEQLVKNLAARYNGGRLDDQPARWIESSPVAHVDAGDPPMLLAHSQDETVVPVDQQTSMREALEASGVEVDTVTFSGTAHASDYRDRIWGRTVAFLRDHL
jgi:acetyl esterase/lipase